MKIERSKEFWLAKARLEGDSAVGAGERATAQLEIEPLIRDDDSLRELLHEIDSLPKSSEEPIVMIDSISHASGDTVNGK